MDQKRGTSSSISGTRLRADVLICHEKERSWQCITEKEDRNPRGIANDDCDKKRVRANMTAPWAELLGETNREPKRKGDEEAVARRKNKGV